MKYNHLLFKKKMFFSTLTILLGFFNCYSQPYESIFGTSYTSWSIQIEGVDHGDTDSLTTVYDTTFNNFNYKYVQNSYFIGFSGFLREDTLLGKAWFYAPLTATEELIMDLSLNVGDTFYLNSYNITVVDSIYYLNGKKHIQFDKIIYAYNDTITAFKPLTFIEGVGSNAGIIYQHGWGQQNYLLCASKDFSQIYVDSFFNGNCYVTWVGIDELNNKTNWKLYPNPFSEFAILKIDDVLYEESSIFIYDVYGRLVKEMNNITSNEIIINKNNLQNGIYFFYLKRKHKIIASGKMIIH